MNKSINPTPALVTLKKGMRGSALRVVIPAGMTAHLNYLLKPEPLGDLQARIKASTTDTVSLTDGYVMLVDDTGHDKRLPVNGMATRLYWDKCGRQVEHVIRGDVVVVPDADFGSAL